MIDNSDSVIDLRERLGAIGDQGRRGTCVAFALTALHVQALGETAPPLSEEFVYWSAKSHDQIVGEGTTYEAAVKGMARAGQAKSSLWPYDETVSHLDLGYRPSIAATTDAMNRRAQGTSLYVTLNNLRTTLETGKSVAIAIPIWDELESADGLSVVLLPEDVATMTLEHAVVIAGHNPMTHAVLIRNSWGIKWGDGGYAWVEDTLLTAVTNSLGWTLASI